MSTAKMFQYLASLGYAGSLNDKWNAYFSDLIANGGNTDLPLVGEVVPERELLLSSAATPIASGTIILSHFTAKRSEAINTLTTYTGGTAAGATPTLCRKGIYSVAANGDLTLVASTPNDTALWAATNTAYPKALSATFNKQAGQRYATALLCVTAAAIPLFIGTTGTSLSLLFSNYKDLPSLGTRLTGQTDLPGSIPFASLGGNNIRAAMILS